MITARELLDLGVPQGPEVGAALKYYSRSIAEGISEESALESIKHNFVLERAPKLKLGETTEKQILNTLDIDNNSSEVEIKNMWQVLKNMDEMSRIPVVTELAVMPDACPAGQGITVGGVIAVDNATIPSAHSADICCSMMTSFFRVNQDSKAIMDKIQASTHFGPGGFNVPVQKSVWTNPFLAGLENMAESHLGTQGDGNHFISLGIIANEDVTGLKGACWALTTHHGSRGFGAEVFKRGQKAAEKYTNSIAEDIPKWGAWLSMDTSEGQDYWEALKAILAWTKLNHKVIHEKALSDCGVYKTIYNAHNFVWQKYPDAAPWEKNVYLHGKGATPVNPGEVGIIPLNMAEPILIVRGKGNNYLNFAPHGAGRNESRTAVLKRYENLGDARGISIRDSNRIVAEQTSNLDIRWYNGKPDISESPLAYKSATYIKDAIKKYDLCEIIGEIAPIGCIMAGDCYQPWKNKRKKTHGGNSQDVSQTQTESTGNSEGVQHEEAVESVSAGRVAEETN